MAEGVGCGTVQKLAKGSAVDVLVAVHELGASVAVGAVHAAGVHIEAVGPRPAVEQTVLHHGDCCTLCVSGVVVVSG